MKPIDVKNDSFAGYNKESNARVSKMIMPGYLNTKTCLQKAILQIVRRSFCC